jgi:hypothetical protein
MVDELSTEEIFWLLKEHHAKHNYEYHSVFQSKSFQEFLVNRSSGFASGSSKDEFVRPQLIADYEQRTDVWDDFKITTDRILKDESKVFHIHLREHFQGHIVMKNGKKRKKPSLWAADLTTRPSTVEKAAASHFNLQGFEVSCAPDTLFPLLLDACSSATYSNGDAKIVTNDNWIKLRHMFFDNPDLIISKLSIEKIKINDVVESLLKREISNYIDFITRECLELMDNSFRPETNVEKRNHMLRHMDYFDRGHFLEKEFCNNVWYGCDDRFSLKDKILEFYEEVPVSLLTGLFKCFAIYGIRAGWPDLYLWSGKEFKFVEVKSPNDSLHLNQAKFYKYYMKPLGVTYNVGRVVPLKNSV